MSLFAIFGCFSAERGSGLVISKPYSVSEFNRVDLRGSGNIYLSQSDSCGVHVEAEDNFFPHLIISVKRKVLIIERKRGKQFRNTKPINFHISMVEVQGLKISGSGQIVGKTSITSKNLNLEIYGSGKLNIDVNTQKLSTNISGSGHAIFSGKAEVNEFKVSGSGKLDAFHLEAWETLIQISGSGHANVNSRDRLSAIISGSGKIRYKGNPNLYQEVSGSGSIRKAE